LITVKYRYRAGVNAAYGSCTVPYIQYQTDCRLHLLVVCATFDVESPTHHRWSCSVKHLAAENVTVNDCVKDHSSICQSCRCQLGVGCLSCRPTFDVLFCCCILACLGFEKLFHELFHYDFYLKYYPIISCRGNVLLGKLSVGETS